MFNSIIKNLSHSKPGYIVVAVILAICLSNCSTTSDIYKSEKLSENNFRNYKTYAFLPTTDTAYTNFFHKAPFEKMLASEAKKQLSKKGMTLDTIHPDCLFTYKLVLNRNYAANQEQEVVYNPEVYSAGFDNQARIYTFSSNNQPAVYSGKMNIDTLREGTMIIDMIDIKENKVVWRSTAQGKRPETYQQPTYSTVSEIVKGMFSKFPK